MGGQPSSLEHGRVGDTSRPKSKKEREMNPSAEHGGVSNTLRPEMEKEMEKEKEKEKKKEKEKGSCSLF